MSEAQLHLTLDGNRTNLDEKMNDPCIMPVSYLPRSERTFRTTRQRDRTPPAPLHVGEESGAAMTPSEHDRLAELEEFVEELQAWRDQVDTLLALVSGATEAVLAQRDDTH